MTTTQEGPPRPSLARRHTTSSERKHDESLDQGVRVTLAGETYEARLGDVTPAIARELRRATGLGFYQVMEALATAPDIDVVSAVVWVARRIRGELVDIDDVAVGYAEMLSDGFDIDVASDAEDVDSPEA